ncbi:PREDICTED: myb-like protein X isoform X5 [Rhagoletis zephyria]|uniref:myb-like protein X isoform X5 n=1 Tax=Rhagoletis zephyria TaxID=28612 RepID=UPI000811A301|nr:PREDICTED: myb-like protein X isoform X5 [Rhagoletis zephyria]
MPPKRRRRFQGLYYHSSPPKVLPMNGQASNQGRKRRDGDDFSVKLSTIRIWMHEKDIGKLTRILWAGQGSRLCQQASTNPRVKRFLAAVPYVMNSIKDVHQAVIDNNLETLQAKMEPPVPPALITCRDANGLNLIHKAAGLGHTKILEYLIGIWPDGVAETDITGKTPLHWAASHKNNMRCYTLLTQTGCDEEAMDYKMKSPTYYRHKPNDIERAFLVYVPEAPRVSPDVATDWEALSEDVGDGGKKLDIKIPDTNGIHGHIIDESIENISEVDLNDGISATEEEQPATPITNGTASDSIPQTPVKDDDNDEPADEEDGEGAIPVNENAETEAINGNANGETEEVEAEAEDETASEAAEEAAEPEVEAIEGETNMKTLNEPTTTTNERDEHAQQGENETTTATAESKNLTESESTKDAETKPEEKEIEEATKVEAGATEREEKKESDVLVEAGDETINENEESSGEKEDEKAVEKADEKEDEKVVGDVGKATEAEEEQKVGDGIKENSSNEKDEEEEAQASVDELLNKEVAAIELKTTKSDEKLVNESKENAKECGSKMGEDNERDEDTKNLNESTSVVDNNDKGTASEEAKVIEEKSKEVGQVDKEGNIEQSKQEKGVENGNEIKENENEEKLDKESMGKRISKENEEMKDNENETVEKEKGEQINNESEVSKIAENAFKVVEGEKEEADDENMKDETYEKQKMLDKVAGNKDVNDENEKEKLDEKDKEKEQEKEKESEQEKTKETLDGKTTGERTDTAIENLVEHKNEIIDEKKSSMSEESVIENEGETDNNPQSAQLHTTEPENNDNSNKNGAKEKTNQGALKVNNKTEEDVKNEIDQKPNNSKEIAINNNSIESETITVNGERKRTVKADKETGEKVSIATPESRGEKINETNEQKSGKMPRLTTAKAMRGRRNGSATKRNGSAKKKNDALIEGDNESEDDDDEEDEVQFGML